MGTSHCRRFHGFTMLFVLFLSSVFSLASKMNVYFHRDRKRNLSGSNPPPHNVRGTNYTMCATHREAKDGLPMPLDFDCQIGFVISEITFADYGQSTGTCKKFKRGNCGASNTLKIVREKCLKKTKCKLFVPDKIFGPTQCKGPIRLVIDATCTKT